MVEEQSGGIGGEMSDVSNRLATRPKTRIIIVESDESITDISSTIREIIEPMSLPPSMNDR